jgi:SAM-dependent methyltransferase
MNEDINIQNYNRQAWDRHVDQGNVWTLPVTPERVERARLGDWSLLLTPQIPVPRAWFGEVYGKDILGLASGGGQQGPLLAAAGGRVTILDNAPRQLEMDRLVAEREGLALTTVLGSMSDLSAFPDSSFDLVFHPVSNCYVPDVLPVWREAFRVLRPGGVLLAGFNNPVFYIFDMECMQKGELRVRYTLPYSDLTSPTEDERRSYLESGSPLEFGHSLDDQIGGQLAAGFLLAGFYEDYDTDGLLCRHMPTYMATRAVKPQ